MNDTQKQTLRKYYYAYLHANGRKKTQSLVLSFKRGWYSVNGTKFRRGELERATKVLLERPRQD